MNTAHQTRLEGLDARRPMDFLAALGALTAATTGTNDHETATLHFDIATPIISPYSLDDIAASVFDAYTRLADSPAANPQNLPGATDTVKFNLKDHNSTRCYLQNAIADEDPHTLRLATAMAPEGAIQTTPRHTAKPYAFDFTAGRQRFLRILRECAPDNPADVDKALATTPSGLTRLRWGHADGRNHARYAGSPSAHAHKKDTAKDPTLAALALLGTSLFPSWATGRNKATTQNFLPGDPEHPRAPRFVWPLWQHPASLPVCQSLLAAVDTGHNPRRFRLWASWGITRVYAATVRRDAHGGGRFAAPILVAATT